MAGEHEREKLISQVVRRTAETLTLEEVGRNVLPRLERLMGAGTSLLYHTRKERPLAPVAGAIAEGLDEYAERFVTVDPLQRVMKRKNPSLLIGTRCREWKDFRAHRALAEFSDRQGISWFFHLRLSDTGHMAPGFVGIVCGRSARREDFGREEIRAAAAVLPALRSAVRRAGRVSQALAAAGVVESLLEQVQGRALLALDLRGKLLWMSSPAEGILASHLGGRRALPEPLIAGARRLGSLAAENAPPTANPMPFSVAIDRAEGPPIEAELFLARRPSGEYFVAADLGGERLPPDLADLARCRGLTRAETEVLSDLARGLSNAEIARRRFVSIPTIETHVTRILHKLGARSRLHAAVLALNSGRGLERPSGTQEKSGPV